MDNKSAQEGNETPATVGQDLCKSKSDMIVVLYFRKVEINRSSIEYSITEWSAISLDGVLRPSRARVTDPSGAVLLGMEMEQAEPNIEYTPRHSARSLFRLILFCTSISGDNCSERLASMSLVRLANCCTL